MSVVEAKMLSQFAKALGRRGGNKLKKQRGNSYYSEIGKISAAKRKAKKRQQTVTNIAQA